MLRRCLCGARQDPRGTTLCFAYGDRGERTEFSIPGQGTVYYGYDGVANMTAALDGKTDSAA